MVWLACVGWPETPRVFADKSGGAPVARVDRRILSRVVVVGLIAAALGLSGCGRKGPLEAAARPGR